MSDILSQRTSVTATTTDINTVDTSITSGNSFGRPHPTSPNIGPQALVPHLIKKDTLENTNTIDEMGALSHPMTSDILSQVVTSKTPLVPIGQPIIITTFRPTEKTTTLTSSLDPTATHLMSESTSSPSSLSPITSRTLHYQTGVPPVNELSNSLQPGIIAAIAVPSALLFLSIVLNIILLFHKKYNPVAAGRTHNFIVPSTRTRQFTPRVLTPYVKSIVVPPNPGSESEPRAVSSRLRIETQVSYASLPPPYRHSNPEVLSTSSVYFSEEGRDNSSITGTEIVGTDL
ncbi:hypothetical protein BDQ17DRAFT_1426656 [Cyathus striatus]|nr:hypothetical protein BDQ17DRAFT_1426656 [Cyathus striatus]